MKITKPARSRFFNFGCAISRYTCASVSNPLMASSEWPRPIMMAIAVMDGASVPFSQPSASRPKCMFPRVRQRHRLAPFFSTVTRHQTIRIPPSRW